jgi:hypothetical protein
MHSKYYTVFIILLFLVIPFGRSHAADVTLTPSLSLRGEYNDNIDFSRTNKQDDYIGTVSPGLTFGYATDVLNFGAQATVGVVRYLDQTNQDNETQNYGLNASYRMFERLSIRVNGSYVKDTTLDTELQETGLVERRSDRKRYGGGGGLSYQISEVLDMALNYNYTKTDYDLSDYIDSKGHSVSLPFNYSFNNRLDTFTLTPYYRNYDSDENKVDSYGLSLGLAHTFTETLKGSATAGPRYTETEDNTGKTDDGWGWTADVSLTKSWQTATASLGYTRDLNYTAEGRTVEVNRFSLATSKMLTSRFSIKLAGSLYFTKSKGISQDEDTRYYTVTPSLNYMITKNHSMELAYSYSNEYDKTLADNRELDRNTVWLVLNFNFPQKW